MGAQNVTTSKGEQGTASLEKLKWGESVEQENKNLKNVLFDEIENAPVFSSRERLEKLLFACCGKSRPVKKIVKTLAKDAQKAYKVGTEDGESGKPAVPFVGLDEVSATFKNAEIGRDITKFIYEAYVCGYGIGAAKYKTLKEVAKE